MLIGFSSEIYNSMFLVIVTLIFSNSWNKNENIKLKIIIFIGTTKMFVNNLFLMFKNLNGMK